MAWRDHVTKLRQGVNDVMTQELMLQTRVIFASTVINIGL